MTQTIQQQLSEMAQSIDDLWAGMNGIAVGPQGISNMMIQPKSVTAGNISVQSLQSVNAKTGSLSVTGGITMATSGSFSSGQTAYDTGTGFWMEYNGGTPRFSIGNSAGNKITWDGSALAITGVITATSGTIGGWTIGSTTLVGGGVTLDSSGLVSIITTGIDAGAFSWRDNAAAGGVYGYLQSANGNIFVGRTGGYSLKMTDVAFSLYPQGSAWNLYAPGIEANATGVQVAGKLYPGKISPAPSTQATRYIYDDGTRIKIGGGDLDVSGGLINFGGPLTAGGAMPSATKAIAIQASGTSYYIPVYTSYNLWAA